MKAIVVTLQQSGHDLYTATDGLQGLYLVERERPELLLTDVTMPGLNGYELIEAIRARPRPAARPSRAGQRVGAPGGDRRGLPPRRSRLHHEALSTR